jgi:hypothetical protein
LYLLVTILTNFWHAVGMKSRIIFLPIPHRPLPPVDSSSFSRHTARRRTNYWLILAVNLQVRALASTSGGTVIRTWTVWTLASASTRSTSKHHGRLTIIIPRLYALRAHISDMGGTIVDFRSHPLLVNSSFCLPYRSDLALRERGLTILNASQLLACTFAPKSFVLIY